MLIVTQDGRSVRIPPQPFSNENSLQQYIYANPTAIPLDEASTSRELRVVCREFPTQSGPIDVLGTDFDAHPYIIETKLYKNPDKRLVLSQVLDYGAALWASEPDPQEVIDRLRADALRRNAPDPISALAAYLDADEQTGNPRARVCDALGAGRFTAIILMDHLSDRLRDLILFMNENSSFRLLAVEL